VQVESLAQMGVQLLLFTLGLEFSLAKLKAVRSVALAGGMIQITAFMILAGLLATAIGASVHEGVFIGALVRGTSSLSPASDPRVQLLAPPCAARNLVRRCSFAVWA
jgi:predicted Kef-type K+ transport protein